MTESPVSRPRARFPRRLLTVPLALVISTLTVAAWAGSYLDRAYFLAKESRLELDYLEYRLDNKELAELLHRMSTARLAAARDMLVPKEVTQAHPHLLLMLENCERAGDAAESKERDRFVVYQRKARDEEEIFRSIMRQLGFPLEDEKKK